MFSRLLDSIFYDIIVLGDVRDPVLFHLPFQNASPLPNRVQSGDILDQSTTLTSAYMARERFRWVCV